MVAKLTPAEKAKALREGGWTRRMHTVPHHGEYTVASHSFNMITLGMALFPSRMSHDLILAIIEHDLPERWVGDVPYPAKRWLNPALGDELSDTEGSVADILGLYAEATLHHVDRPVLAFLDLLELTVWAKEQLDMGNKLMEGTYANGITTLQNMELWGVVGDDVVTLLEGVPVSEDTTWWKEMMKR